MTEQYPWDEQDERQAVDSAGCKYGEIDRPARTYLEWQTDNTQQYMLKIPAAPNGYIRTDDPVSLEANR